VCLSAVFNGILNVLCTFTQDLMVLFTGSFETLSLFISLVKYHPENAEGDVTGSQTTSDNYQISQQHYYWLGESERNKQVIICL
jgi:hypothetical protein